MYAKKKVCQPNRCFFIYCWVYRLGLSKHKLFVQKAQLMKILGFIFCGDQGKNEADFFEAGILRVYHKKT